ncbi:MAG TPA: TfuA-like protein [Candidatus Baltobacteraceae bacterium]|nr:TfuA-like protein [Candidatus Baltobacteraceae bacterium]
MTRIAVLAGPSLPPEDRIDAPNVRYLPSARRGDVAAAADGSDVVLLIDGVFHDDLAPSPKEVLEVCRTTTLIGAASIGALRAVECAPFGARPYGIVARWYGEGFIDGDDEVAVSMDPVTERALSVPLVNVRFLLRLARHRGTLTRVESERVLLHAHRVFYADRTWDDVLESVPAHKRRVLGLLTQHADLKRLDARLALRYALRPHAVDAFTQEPPTLHED